MSPSEQILVRNEIAALTARAAAAEARARNAEGELATARALLSHSRISLFERTDENVPLRAAA